MQTRGIRPMAWNPLEIEHLPQKYATSTDNILLAWVLKHSAKILPVVRIMNPAHLRLLLVALDLVMEVED